MAEKTPNFDLTKPLPSEFYDVGVQNGNMDKIDQALQEHKEGIEALQKGQTGKADLVDGKVPAAQLPSYVDDVIEGYLNNGTFYEDASHAKPISPEKGKIYTDLHTEKTFRWGGTAYVEISKSLALGETPETAYAGDKGKKNRDDLDAHTGASIIGEEGVHDLRYFDNKLQVKNASGGWDTASAGGGGVGPQIQVNVAAGSVVHCSDGKTELTGNADDGTYTFDIPNYGTWEVWATKGDQTTAKESVVITVAQLYTVGLEYFNATLTVNALTGSVVTISNGTKSDTQTSVGGKATFNLTTAGTYSIYATYDGVKSDTKSVNATANGGSYSATCTFITLTVTVDTGSSVTVVNGSTSKNAIATGGKAVFYLPNTGVWTVTATLSGQTATDSISCSSYGAFSLTLAYYKYFGMKIKIGTSSTPTDPETDVEYIDDAQGHGTGWDAWKNEVIFKNIKPCILKDGVVSDYLNPENFAYTASGASAAITTVGNDVMIEIPKLGYKMTKDSTYHYIWITDDPAADGYCYRAHSLDSEGDCDKIYIGAYLAYGDTSAKKLYSVSGKTPTASQTIATFRTWAANRGTGYQQISFYPLTLLQCLYLMMYKNRNGQKALGRGYVDGNSAAIATGGTNAKGMCFGETTGKQQMCFLGIEDFWGNLFQRIDGIYSDASRQILTAFKDFNDTGASYPYTTKSDVTSNISGYMVDVVGTNGGGFVPKVCGGSATVGYADYGYLYASYLAYFGGYWSYGDNAGPFRFDVHEAASNTSTDRGARLIYKHKAA